MGCCKKLEMNNLIEPEWMNIFNMGFDLGFVSMVHLMHEFDKNKLNAILGENPVMRNSGRYKENIMA